MSKLSQEQINDLIFGDEGQEGSEASEVENIQAEGEIESADTQDGGDEGQQVELSIEELAQKQGWNPKFKGDKKLTAEEFLKKSETEAPVMRDTIRRMAEQMKQMEAAFQRQRDLDEKKHQRDLEGKLKELSGEKAKLKEVGLYEKDDFDKYENLSQAENDIKQELEDVKAPKSQPLLNQQQQSQLATWMSKNPWYGTDVELTYEAEQRIPVINNIYKDADPVERLQILEAHMRKKFPEVFGEKKQYVNKVEVTNRENTTASPVQKSKKFTYNDLTPEDKNNFQVFKRMNWGLKKTTGVSVQDLDERIKKTEEEELVNYYEDYKSRGLIK